MAELTEAERVEIESKKEFMDSIPKIAVYGGIMILVWIFTMFVYIPLGWGLTLPGGLSVANFIMIVGFLVLLYFAVKILKEIRDVSNAIGGMIAVRSGPSGATEEEVKDMQSAVKGIVYAIIGTILFVFITSVLTGLNVGGYQIGGAVVGIALVIMFILVIYWLYKAGMSVSKEIGKAAQEKAEKMLEKAKKD